MLKIKWISSFALMSLAIFVNGQKNNLEFEIGGIGNEIHSGVAPYSLDGFFKSDFTYHLNNIGFGLSSTFLTKNEVVDAEFSGFNEIIILPELSYDFCLLRKKVFFSPLLGLGGVFSSINLGEYEKINLSWGYGMNLKYFPNKSKTLITDHRKIRSISFGLQGEIRGYHLTHDFLNQNNNFDLIFQFGLLFKLELKAKGFEGG